MDKKSLFSFFMLFLKMVSLEAMEDLASKFKELRGQKMSAEQELQTLQKKEKLAQNNQELTQKKVDRLEKEIKQERDKGVRADQAQIDKLTKQRDSSASTTEKWASQIPEYENLLIKQKTVLKNIDEELNVIQKEAEKLGYLLSKEGTVQRDWKSFEKTINEKIVSHAGEKSLLLIAEAQNFIEQNQYRYQDQQEALKILSHLMDAENEENWALYKQRLEQINTFLSNQQPKEGINDLDNKLSLYKKIPQDQIAIIKKEYTEQWAPELESLKGTFDEDKWQALQRNIEQASDLMKRRGFKPLDKFDENVLNNMLESLDVLHQQPYVRKKIQTPSQGMISRAFSGIGYFARAMLPESVMQGAVEAIEVTKQLVASSAIGFSQEVSSLALRTPGAVYEGLRNVAGQLEAQGQEGKEIAEKLHEMPNNLESTAQTFKAIDQLLAPIQRTVRWVPIIGPLLEKRIEAPRELMKMFNENQKMGQRVAAGGGLVAQGLVDLANAVGKGINRALDALPQVTEKEKLSIASDVEKARLFIDEAKVGFRQPNPGRFAAAMKPVGDFVKKIEQYIRNLFDTSQSRLQLAQKNYETARVAYFRLLAIDENAIDENVTEETIGKKLQEKIEEAKNDKKLRQNIALASQQMARAADDIVAVYKEVQSKLASSAVSLEFIVKAYGTVVIEDEPKNVIDFINSVADLQDQRVAFLQAAGNGVNALSMMAQKYDLFADNAQQTIDAMSGMISGQLVKTVKEYNEFIYGVDKALKHISQQVG